MSDVWRGQLWNLGVFTPVLVCVCAQVWSEVNQAVLDYENRESTPKLAKLLKLLLWAQNELDQKKVKYPKMTDLSTGTIEDPKWAQQSAVHAPIIYDQSVTVWQAGNTYKQMLNSSFFHGRSVNCKLLYFKNWQEEGFFWGSRRWQNFAVLYFIKSLINPIIYCDNFWFYFASERL